MGMPLAQGMSCDSLEMRNTNVAVTKSVDRNNNGKSFKITRSFLTSTALASVTDATNVACAAGKCHEAVQAVDSIILGGASCDVKAASDVSYPLNRDAGTVTISGNAAVTSIAIATLGTGVSGTNCESMYLGRHVITLDSMPLQVQFPSPKQCSTSLQLEVVVLPKLPKVRMKVLNVLTVVRAMERAVYVLVTKAIQVNRAKRKRFWFRLTIAEVDSNHELHSQHKINSFQSFASTL